MDKEKLIAFLKSRLFPTPCDSYDDGRDFAYQDVLDVVESGEFDAETQQEADDEYKPRFKMDAQGNLTRI